jgi:hypothetical protein
MAAARRGGANQQLGEGRAGARWHGGGEVTDDGGQQRRDGDETGGHLLTR